MTKNKLTICLLLLLSCAIFFCGCAEKTTTNPVVGSWTFTTNDAEFMMIFSADGQVAFGQEGLLLEGSYSFPAENRLTIVYHVSEDVTNEYSFTRENENELTLISDSGSVFHLTKK